MKPSDLRIGNWITYEVGHKDGKKNKIQCQVKPNEIEDLFENKGFFIYEPIPLTEEWLQKFGFIVDNELWHKKEFDILWTILIRLQDGAIELQSIIDEQVNEEVEILILPSKVKYVHQLQNLYHSLTGEELKVNETVTA